MLSEEQVRRFINDGFVRIDRAFPREIADAGLGVLWRATGCEPHDPATWTKTVIRFGPVGDRDGTQPLYFHEAANTPLLYDAFDKLVGRGRWRKRPNVGNFVVRFPSEADPGDLGWHIDLSFPGETGDPEGRDYSSFPMWGRTTHRHASVSVPTSIWHASSPQPGKPEWLTCSSRT